MRVNYRFLSEVLRGQCRGRFLAIAFFVVVLGFVTVSYVKGGIFHILLRLDVSGEEKVALVRQYFLSWGWWAYIVYVMIIIVEVVVAPIPGAGLYAPGGLIFGGFMGGSLSLLGNVVGAGMCHKIARVLGRFYAERYMGGFLNRYEQKLRKQGIWIVFLLRVNPLTSSDLVSYAAGLTSIPAWKVIMGTFLGMAPLCYAQAYIAEKIFEAFPFLFFPMLIICIICASYAIWTFKRFLNSRKKVEHEQ